MKNKQLTNAEIAAINAALRSMPSIKTGKGVPTFIRTYGPFIPAIKAMRKLGYTNVAIGSAIFHLSGGNVGPRQNGYGYNPNFGQFSPKSAGLMIAQALNHKG